jgi:hypothetical protein
VAGWGGGGGGAVAVAGCTGFVSGTDGGLATVVCAGAGGVGEFMCTCEWTDGVEGARWGVCMRWTGGVCEWTMGGVWPSERFTGGMAAMWGCDETTTGEAWVWNWRGGMAYWG